MTQLGEGISISTVEKEPVTEEKKKKVKIRFSIFFDGTLNNRTNVKEGVGSKSYKSSKSSFGIVNTLKGVGSFENALSNVAKMEEYIDKNEEKYIFSMYIEGQGTTNYKADSFHGKALGTAETGVTGRAQKGLMEIFWKIRSLDSDVVIEKLTIDVFGFSRGAAAARNFLHKAMNTKSHGRMPARPLKKRLQNAGFDVEEVEIQFAGLFDTVSSVGLPNQHKYNSSRLHLSAINYAKEVMHLAASEEHRKNFSLTDTNSAGTKEIYLPGVHSDIGGGYPDNYEEILVLFKGNKENVDKEKERLENITGWSEKELKLVKPIGSTRVPINNRIWKLELKRVVRNEYDRIPLHIMADFARINQIKLKIDLEIDHAVEDTFLIPILAKLKSYAGQKVSKVEDWHHNEEWLKELRRKFLHFSAHYSGTGMEPRFVDGERKRLVYEG